MINYEKDNNPASHDLRKKAEELLIKKISETDHQLSESESLKLIHELEVVQIELELQNEELMAAIEKAEVASEKTAELFDFAPTGYFTLSKQGEIMELNLCGAQMLGYDRSFLQNSQFHFFVSSDSRPGFNTFLNKVFTSKVKQSCELTLSGNNILEINVFVTGIVINHEEQALVNVVDISDRKLAIQTLTHSPDIMRYIIDNSRSAIAVLNNDLKYIYVSPRFFLDFVMNDHNLIGKHLYEVFPDLSQNWKDGVHAALAGKITGSEDEPITREDGTIDWTRWECRPWYKVDGSIGGVVIYIESISQKKLADVILREKEVQYSNLANSGLALIRTSGTDKLSNYFNETWLNFTGRTLEQEMGSGWEEGIHPDDYHKYLIAYTTSFDKREKFEVEYRLHHVSDEYRWIRNIGVPAYNSDNEFYGYIIHSYDISQQKQMEAELNEKNKTIEKLKRM